MARGEEWFCGGCGVGYDWLGAGESSKIYTLGSHSAIWIRIGDLIVALNFLRCVLGHLACHDSSNGYTLPSLLHQHLIPFSRPSLPRI